MEKDEHRTSNIGHTPLDDIAGRPPVYQKQDLFKGAKEIIIKHNSSLYRLRETKNGKLILNL